MEYYKTMYDFTNDKYAVLLDIEENTLGFNRYDVNKKAELGVQKIYCTLKEKNILQYDYLANNLSWLVVSDKIKEVMLKVNMGMSEFIPVINKTNEEIIGYLVHCMNILDAFDEKNSICSRKKYVSDGKEYELLSVIKYAVDSSKIGDMDMFKLKESDIPFFVSKHLRDMIISVNAKGFDFLKVKS